MKKCYVCGEEKEYHCFGKTSRMCNPCRKEYDRNRSDRTGKNRVPNEATRARQRRYNAKNLHQENVAARLAVRKAILSGEIIRKSACEVCGKEAVRRDGVTAVQAHHDDYTKPLDVRWLCSACHTAWHRLNKPVAAINMPANGEGK